MTNFSQFLANANFINGEWVGAEDGGTFPVTDPATGRIIGQVPSSGAQETRRAISAAQTALVGWSTSTAAYRASVLRRMAQIMEDNQDALAHLLTTEQGKSLTEARAEIGASAAYLLWFAEEARRVYGDVIPSPWSERRIMVIKQPVGVVAAITPWNFPALMLARKVAAALAAGCTIVVKPASQTPYSALAWGKIAEEAGLPSGVLNIVTGDAKAIGSELTANPAVRKITFTGSTGIGKLLMAQAAGTMKRVSLELGGNAPFLVFSDADIDKAVEGAVRSKFRNSGQTCVCTNRILVQSEIHDLFVDRFAAAMQSLRIGNGLEPGTDIGPLIDVAATQKVEEHIADALDKGAKLIAGGRRHELGGSFFQPTLLADVDASMKVAREETFGPLAPVFRFETEDQAIAMANATEFGLAAYVYTQDLGRAFRVMERLEAGQVGVNAAVLSTEVAPFGGTKESGIGREGSKYGLDDYLDVKYVCIGIG